MRIWESKLDDKYDVFVERIDGDYGTLKVVDLDTGKELLSEKVGLAYQAIFGPDIDDVQVWQERAIEVVDNL